jgi:hypothetical protein
MIKVKTNASRGYALPPPTDDVLRFSNSIDNTGDGVFEINFSGYFIYAPPVAYIDSNNILMYGTHNVYKTVLTPKPVDRPQFTAFAGTVAGYVTVQEQIQSIIEPTGGTSEPKFFYVLDPSAHGYFVETKVIVFMNSSNSVNLRWGSTVDGSNVEMVSGFLKLTKLAQTI